MAKGRGPNPFAAFTLVAVIFAVARMMMFPSPLPDIAPAASDLHFANLRMLFNRSADGVRMELPQDWQFARHKAAVDAKRTALFAARKNGVTCALILDRAKIDGTLDDDVAAIKQTVAHNTYKLNFLNWIPGSTGWFARLIDSSEEILNAPGPATRIIDFKPAGESTASLGNLAARRISFHANVDDREHDFLTYTFAHQYGWQYAFISLIGQPPRECATELAWIQAHLSFQ